MLLSHQRRKPADTSILYEGSCKITKLNLLQYGVYWEANVKNTGLRRKAIFKLLCEMRAQALPSSQAKL